MADSQFMYGREHDILVLSSSTHQAVLMVGDSGVGKSALLDAAQAERARTGLALPSVKLQHGPAAVQVALSAVIAGSLAQLRGERPDWMSPDRLIAAGKRIKTVVSERIRGQVVDHVFGLVRARYGEEIADTLTLLREAWSDSASETLDVKINSVGDQDVVAALGVLAHEVAELSKKDITIALDDVHNATEEDRRRLADLASELPSSVYLRLAGSIIGTQTPDWVARFHASTHVVRLEPLSLNAVSQWFDHADIEQTQRARILAITNSYPFYVQSAIELVRQGVSTDDLSSMTMDDLVGLSTHNALSQLSIELKDVIGKLSAFADALSNEQVIEYLKIESLRWANLRSTFYSCGLFVGSNVSTSWFHDLRRYFIWEHVLDKAARAEIADEACPFLKNSIINSSDPSASEIVSYSRLVCFASQESELSKRLRAVAMLPSDELAALASIVELTDPSSRVLHAEAVIDHARALTKYTVAGPLSLSALEAKEFSKTMSDRENTVVWHTLEAAELVIVVGGAFADKFGRVPTPNLGALIFSQLIGASPTPFTLASYSLSGHASSMASAESLDEEAQSSALLPGMVVSARQPGLLLEAKYEHSYWSAAVKFHSDENRQSVIDDIGSKNASLLNRTIEILDMFSYPSAPVRSRRFLNAFEILLKVRMNSSFGSPTVPNLSTQLSPQHQAEQRAATLGAFRDLSDSVEKMALDLKEPVGIVHAVTETGGEISQALIYVRGGAGVRFADYSLLPGPGEPYGLTKTAEMLTLGVDETIDLITHSRNDSKRNAVLGEALRLFKKATKFNKLQNQFLIPSDLDALTSLIVESRIRLSDDIRAFANLIPYLDLPGEIPAPYALSAVLYDFPDPWGAGVRKFIRWAKFDAVPAHAPVALVYGTEAVFNSDAAIEDLARLVGVPASTQVSAGQGEAAAVIAQWLGYSHREFSLTF